MGALGYGDAARDRLRRACALCARGGPHPGPRRLDDRACAGVRGARASRVLALRRNRAPRGGCGRREAFPERARGARGIRARRGALAPRGMELVSQAPTQHRRGQGGRLPPPRPDDRRPPRRVSGGAGRGRASDRALHPRARVRKQVHGASRRGWKEDLLARVRRVARAPRDLPRAPGGAGRVALPGARGSLRAPPGHGITAVGGRDELPETVRAGAGNSPRRS